MTVTTIPRLLTRTLIGLAILAGTGANAATVSDDFESSPVGFFPSAKWQDAAGPDFSPPNSAYPQPPLPSALVVNTTDAFGNPTRAVQIVEGLGSSKGLYAVDGIPVLKTLQADVRVLQYSNGDPNTVRPYLDSPVSLGFFKADPADSPFVNLYLDSGSHTWHLGYTGNNAIGPDVDDYSLGGPQALINVWYTASLSWDTVGHSFTAQVFDTATGLTLVSATINLGAQALPDDFNATMLWAGEASATLPPTPGGATLANISQFDNINTAPVPEPASALMWGAGVALLVVKRRRAARPLP